MPLSHALSIDLVPSPDTVAAAINHLRAPLPLHPANAQAEFVEMVHIRTFSFDPLSMDDLDAFNLALTLSGPCIGVCADGTVSVLESQGEALLVLLKAKGLDFKYESSWTPGTEAWITDFYAPPFRDQDDWH